MLLLVALVKKVGAVVLVAALAAVMPQMVVLAATTLTLSTQCSLPTQRIHRPREEAEQGEWVPQEQQALLPETAAAEAQVEAQDNLDITVVLVV